MYSDGVHTQKCHLKLQKGDYLVNCHVHIQTRLTSYFSPLYNVNMLSIVSIKLTFDCFARDN